MKKNLTARTVVIVVTILLCIYGIIGFPTSKAALSQNVENNIRLGLDLKGGTHLVLEVQVQDAVKADSSQCKRQSGKQREKQHVKPLLCDGRAQYILHGSEIIRRFLSRNTLQALLYNLSEQTWVAGGAYDPDQRHGLIDEPCFIFSSAAISRKPRSSSSNSLSTRSFRNNDRSPFDRLRSSDMALTPMDIESAQEK